MGGCMRVMGVGGMGWPAPRSPQHVRGAFKTTPHGPPQARLVEAMGGAEKPPGPRTALQARLVEAVDGAEKPPGKSLGEKTYAQRRRAIARARRRVHVHFEAPNDRTR